MDNILIRFIFIVCIEGLLNEAKENGTAKHYNVKNKRNLNRQNNIFLSSYTESSAQVKENELFYYKFINKNLQSFDDQIFRSENQNISTLSRQMLPLFLKVKNIKNKIDATKVGRKRRSKVIRPIKIVEIPETTIGELINLNGKRQENFRFKEQYEGLKINANTGVISLLENSKLDFEKNKSLDLKVIVTRVDDKTYEEEQPIKIKLIDVNDELPIISNRPLPLLATVQSNSPAGTPVYKFIGMDGDENCQLKYHLESGGEGRFSLDPDTGVLATLGYGFHIPGKEYDIGVSVSDIAYQQIDTSRGRKLEQKSGVYFLRVLVGEREPQFYESRFEIFVAEDTTPLISIGDVKAISHQGRQLTYELVSNSGLKSEEFSIDQRTGAIELLKNLDFETGPRKYMLVVRAVELGRNMKTGTAEVIITVTDVNDNAPVFALSQYVVRDVAETVAIGTDILQVTATDLDSGENGRLTYKVADGHFQIETINNIGYIKVARRLDYDQSADHIYLFSVVVMDNGNPILSGTSMVQLSVTNVNDEDPIFLQSSERIQVSEDTPIGTVIHVAQAFDADGDGVTYSFNGKHTKFGPFAIDPTSGIITLTKHLGSFSMNAVRHNKNLDSYQRLYQLNLVAEDDGKCCSGVVKRSGNGVVIVEVKDVNNNAPMFTDCSSYMPVVNERENVGTFVIKVNAVDLDSGSNGNVTYSIVKTADHLEDKFRVDPHTGVVTTSDVFDREAKVGISDFGLTVKAEDGGLQPLAGFCTFRIKIGDKNDNPPVFNLPHYTTSVEEKSAIGKKKKVPTATLR